MKRVVVCVGGSIAAYKACDLVSKLVQAGRVVDVAMTAMARRFVQPLSFQALTHRPVFTDESWADPSGSRGSMPHDHLRITAEASARMRDAHGDWDAQMRGVHAFMCEPESSRPPA